MIFNIEKINPIKREIVRQIADIASDNKRIKKMIVFGSSVTDACTAASDVDICVDVSGEPRGIDLFQTFAQINRVCDYNCDYLFYNKISGHIKSEIDQKGVVVYELS